MYYCKDTSETATNYTEYLKTIHWKNLKTRMYKSKYKYECHCCKCKTGLQLHHKTYKRVGNEHLNDLTWLCKICHEEVHLYATDNSKLWSASRKVKKKRAKGY